MTSNNHNSDIAELYAAMSYEESRDVFPAVKNWLTGKDPLKCFYNGNLDLVPESGKCKTESMKDPCNDDYFVSIIVPSAEDIKSVLQSSLLGQKSWNSLDQHTRGKLISSIAKKIDEQRDLLAEAEALTIGAALSETKCEVTRASTYFRYYASWAHAIKTKIEDPENGVLMVSLSKPAPILALAAAVAPALAAGRAVVLNPPLEASLTSFLFAELCSTAGVLSGVVNVVPGSLEVAKELIGKNVEKMVTWGSKCSSGNVCIEMADISRAIVPFYYGKSLGIVFDSSDQSSAIEILLKNMSFSYQQMPWSVRTILVEESAFPTFVTMLKKKLSSCKAGSSRDRGIDIGLPKGCDASTGTFLKDTLSHFLQRGTEVFQIPIVDSLFFPPTLIIGSDAEMNSIVKDYEVLPFVSVLPFRNSKEALEFANKSQFGVAASVWTTCLSLAMHMAANLEVGTVWINDHGLLDPSVPFSSRKQGFGCIGSQRGLQQFLSFEREEISIARDVDSNKDASKLQIQKVYCAHYGGAFKQTTSDACYSILSSSGSHYRVHKCDKNDVKKAVDAAKAAQQKWWKLGSNARAALLLGAADKFQETYKSFLKFFRSSASDNEKELENSVNNLYYWASRCNNMSSFGNDCPIPNCVVQGLQDPIGVIGVLVEDSSELETSALAVISAISFGNSVVVIPNYQNPVLALEFCAFLTNLKVPPGLVNVLPGDQCTLYSELVFHRDVQAVWYSGSNKLTLNTIHKMANRLMKFLWKFPDTSAIWNASEFEYAASYTKAVWLPKENASC